MNFFAPAYKKATHNRNMCMAFMNYTQTAKGLVILHRIESEDIAVRIEKNGREFPQQMLAAGAGLLVVVHYAAGL